MAVTFNATQGPQAPSGQVVMPQVGLQGGVVAAPQQIRQGKDWYPDGMTTPLGGNDWPGFLNDVFEAPLQAARQERVWKGFTDAAAGMTAEEIRAERPWFTKLFGPTEYESGAIMYETQEKVSNLARDWAIRMPELRQLPAEEVNNMLLGEMKGMQGQSPFANMVLQGSMMKQFAPLVELHTKERAAWQQAEMLKKQISAAESASGTYQALATRSAMLGKDHPMQVELGLNMEAAKNAMFDSTQPGQFQTDESIETFFNTLMRSNMRKGNFYGVEAFINEGFFESVSVEAAERMQKAYVTAQGQYRNKFTADNPEFEQEIARLQSMKEWGIGGEPVLKIVDDINRTWQAMTGASMPYYDSDQRAAFAADGMKSWMRRFERLEDKEFAVSQRLAEKEEKAMAEARNTAQLTEFFQAGAIGEVMNAKGVERGDADRASSSLFWQIMGEGKVAQAAGYLIRNQNNTQGSYVNEQLSTQLKANLQNSLDEQVSDAFMQQYNMWKAINDGVGARFSNGELVMDDNAQGQATALAYYGPTVNAKMKEFDAKLSRGGMQADRAYATTFGEWVASGTPDFRGIERGDMKANQQAFVGGLDKMDAGLFERTFGNGFALHPSSRAMLGTRAGVYWGQLDDGLLPGNRAKAAINMALSAGRMEIAGGHVLDYGSNQMPLRQFMDDPDGERTSLLFDSVLRSKLKEVGTSPDGNSVIVRRLPDDGGEPVYSVYVESDDGVYATDIRGRDLEALETTQIKEQTLKPTPIPTLGFEMNTRQSTAADEAYWGGTAEQVTERGRRNRAKVLNLLGYPLEVSRRSLEKAGEAKDWLYNLNSPKK